MNSHGRRLYVSRFMAVSIFEFLHHVFIFEFLHQDLTSPGIECTIWTMQQSDRYTLEKRLCINVKIVMEE